ncbi:hypothetical protein NESM_000534800 [Novymonas esmeraldas]|uniref:Uncharacterized protein n=1 Tax=Novymonas esmeraldas TaxID=1808958 RepID=A0AAW0EQL8_9TRYP
MPSCVVYVLGTESSGKSDLVRQLEYLSQGHVRTTPTVCTPTMGQEVTELRLQPSPRAGEVVLELRELGGSLMNAWESFIESRKAKDGAAAETTFALLYVVDGIAPQQLPLASVMYRYLTHGTKAACARWPCIIAVQKCAGVNAVTAEEVHSFFLDDADAAPCLGVLEVDSWNGVGLGDVMKHLESAFGAVP